VVLTVIVVVIVYRQLSGHSDDDEAPKTDKKGTFPTPMVTDKV